MFWHKRISAYVWLLYMIICLMKLRKCTIVWIRFLKIYLAPSMCRLWVFDSNKTGLSFRCRRIRKIFPNVVTPEKRLRQGQSCCVSCRKSFQETGRDETRVSPEWQEKPLSYLKNINLPNVVNLWTLTPHPDRIFNRTEKKQNSLGQK